MWADRSKLRDPFRPELVEWKVQATTKDNSRCCVVPFVDLRHYMARLDAVDPDWIDVLQVLPGPVVVASVTVGGITRTSTGESDAQDENAITSAEAQAFKRACAKHGLGRYLYFIPPQWVAYDEAHKTFNRAELKPLPKWAQPGAPPPSEQEVGPGYEIDGQGDGTARTMAVHATAASTPGKEVKPAASAGRKRSFI